MKHVLVYGLAVAGQAVAHALHRRGVPFTAVDDRPSDGARSVASALGVDLVESPSQADLAALVRRCDLVIPAPGLPETHPVFDVAHTGDVEVCSEIEVAYRWEQERPGGPRPFVAITGTDGKTTTTELTAAMVATAGRRTMAVGNTDTPLISVVDDDDLDVFVVEASSFRLAFTSRFRAEASAWLNLAEDHQNWHRSLDTYAAAKARLWQAVRPDDVVIGSAHDPIVRRYLDTIPARRFTVGLTDADYRVDHGRLMTPRGAVAEVNELARALPHDLTNGLTAAALTLETGLASVDDVARTLAVFTPPRHRIELVADHAGVRWFDDSKATTPHAALTAVAAFPSVVWIAGGRNKGLDLSVLTSGAAHLRGVVALGEAGPEVAAAFDGRCPVRLAPTMDDAVAAAAALARDGDVVLLSPACASYDAYQNYSERGDDFVRCVRDLTGGHR